MSITFPDVATAVAADVAPVELFVRIGGVAVTATEATVRHGVDQPIGTCTVIVEAPRPASATINAELEVEMGYAGAVRRVFHGYIPNDESITDDRGRWVRIDGRGWAAWLSEEEYSGVEITGPVSLKDAFRSLCEMREIPAHLADDTTYPDGVTEIELGGNDQINAGHIRFANTTDPLTWVTRNAELYGYRVFDAPDGTVRLARVSGLPPESETVAMHYEEGVNCFQLQKRRDTRQMGTYIEVVGARYTASDGGAVQIRSIPAEVPNEETLEPQGYRHLRISSQDIVTDVQAAGVRNVFEIDRSEVQEFVTWECVGHPELQPGDVVTVTGASHGLTAQRLWLTRIDQSVSDRGYMATMTGWYGAGEALAAGNDCRTEAVTIPGDGVVHMGTETLSWYKDSSPDGTEVTIDFTVTSADYSSLRLTGRVHGSNSIKENTAVTGSKIEVWQLPDPSLPSGPTNEIRRAGSVDLPTANEELRKRRNYSSSNTYWQTFSLPLSGNLKEGAAELRLIAGEYDEPVEGVDDFEIMDLQLTYCGVGIPSLPGQA
jgi:hypothetical protein